jgi:hypothetical protein
LAEDPRPLLLRPQIELDPSYDQVAAVRAGED